MKQSLIPIGVLVAALGCSSSTPPPSSSANASNTPPADVDAHVSSLTNEPDAAAAAPTPPPAPAPVRITAGERRAVPAPTPRVTITAPRNGVTVREDRVEVRLGVTNWRDVANAGDHRHVHLVLDDEPYRRVDDPSQPVVLEHLSPGTHVLRAFPGWETHETVKESGAFAVSVFHVGRPAQSFAFNPRSPLLTYSRPKGEVNGSEADRILLDFYLSNIPANGMGAEGFRVRPSIDGTALDDLTAWVPYYIENLPDGPHTIRLQLIGRDGAPVAGPFNQTEHRITVNRSAAAAPHAPAAGVSVTPNVRTNNPATTGAPMAPATPTAVSVPAALDPAAPPAATPPAPTPAQQPHAGH